MVWPFSAANGRWALATPMLFYCMIIFNFGDVLFGLDTGSFGSIQTLPSWLLQFGQDIKQADGTTVKGLEATRTSLMNSVVWLGKAVGVCLWEPTIEYLGYKKAMYVMGMIQILAIIIELTAKEWIQFSAGRTIAYVAAGMVENLVPNYMSEVTPVPLRAFFSGAILTAILLGNIWGVGMSRIYATELGKVGWLVPVGIQIVPAFIVLVGVPFTPESPRWLISKDRKEEAVKSLVRLRSKSEVEQGMPNLEADAIEQAIQESKLVDQANWLTLFKGTYFRRAMIVAWLFIFQQITGMQFVNSYGPTFYKNMGLGAKAFTYQTIPYASCIVTVVLAQIYYDRIGRRPFLIFGCATQTLFMLLLAGVGTKKNLSTTDINTVVMCMIMFYTMARYSLSLAAFVIGSEIGGTRMRKKIIAWGTFWDVVASFVATYSIPYLLKPPLSLGAKVGWIFGGICAASLIFVTFFVPELKGRSLEETDELFEQKLWAWQFERYTTTGVGARIAALEGDQGHQIVDQEKHAGDAEMGDAKGEQVRQEQV